MKVSNTGEQQSGDGENSGELYFMSDSRAEIDVELKIQKQIESAEAKLFPSSVNNDRKGFNPCSLL